jgi:cell division protein FtsQ
LKEKVKIRSVFLFVLLVGTVVSLASVLNDSKNEEIKSIQISGNFYLSSKEYMKFAMLQNKGNYTSLSLKVVRDRLEKHPYIKKADLILENNKLKINIFEKKFEALLTVNKKEFFITDNAMLIPKLPNTQKIDYPIISGPAEINKITEFKKATLNNDVKIAIKMITALKILDKNLYEKLSEINLRSGKDIIMILENIDAPIIIGRGREIEKMVLLGRLIQQSDLQNIKGELEYIDLRYSQFLYVGKTDINNFEQENNT